MTYEEYVAELMQLLFHALTHPGRDEEEPRRSQEGGGEGAEKNGSFFSAGVYKIFQV